MIGEYGENMPTAVGASSTTYFADYFYTNVVSNTGQRGVLFGGHANYGAAAGFSCAYSLHTASLANATVGSRLCYKTRELATYAGRQFEGLYNDFLLIKK